MIFEFFIAFFGIIYYALKSGAEKSAHTSAARGLAQHRQERDAWIETHTDLNFEKEMLAYIMDSSNYSAIRTEIEPILEEIPSLKDILVFGEEWRGSNLYESYWMDQGKSLPKWAESELRKRQDIVKVLMIVSRGVFPSNSTFPYFGSGCVEPFRRAFVEIEFFRWCVRKLRETANITDPVSRVEISLWEYNFRPLVNGGVIVPDDEIVMRPGTAR